MTQVLSTPVLTDRAGHPSVLFGLHSRDHLMGFDRREGPRMRCEDEGRDDDQGIPPPRHAFDPPTPIHSPGSRRLRIFPLELREQDGQKSDEGIELQSHRYSRAEGNWVATPGEFRF
jgi:hypothetical protein